MPVVEQFKLVNVWRENKLRKKKYGTSQKEDVGRNLLEDLGSFFGGVFRDVALEGMMSGSGGNSVIGYLH